MSQLDRELVLSDLIGAGCRSFGSMPRLSASVSADGGRTQAISHIEEMLMAKVINEDDVSTEALLQLFRCAFLKAKIDDDGDVCITDGLDFPIWVAVDFEERLIRFFTFMQRDEGRPFTEAAAK